MAIKQYKKGDSTNLSPNFKAREFDCPGTGCCNSTPIDSQLVEYLQKIRDHFGKPIEILAYRCPTHNSKTPNASPTSLHCKGQAADFHVDGVSPEEVAKYAESIGVLGIGMYNTKADGHFVHIDTRTNKSFWIGHAQKYAETFGGKPVNKKITVDGIWGKDTTLAAQKVLGTTQDGIISNQSANSKKYLTAASTNSWEFKTSGYQNGSNLIKAIQKLIGSPADGICGYNTVVALQKFLSSKKYYKSTIDGYMGSNTVKAWQSYLNDRL